MHPSPSQPQPPSHTHHSPQRFTTNFGIRDAAKAVCKMMVQNIEQCRDKHAQEVNMAVELKKQAKAAEIQMQALVGRPKLRGAAAAAVAPIPSASASLPPSRPRRAASGDLVAAADTPHQPHYVAPSLATPSAPVVVEPVMRRRPEQPYNANFVITGDDHQGPQQPAHHRSADPSVGDDDDEDDDDDSAPTRDYQGGVDDDADADA